VGTSIILIPTGVYVTVFTRRRNMYKLFISILLSTGCVPFVESLETEEFETGTETIQIEDEKVVFEKSIGGMSFSPGCEFYKEHPPVIDSSWSETSKEEIRRGVKLWEDALGIELGAVPIVGDCSRNNPITSCIVKLDEYCIEGEEPGEQIFLFTNALRDHNFSPAYLADLAAHEVGHYLMIPHTETGIMSTHRNLVKDPQVGEEDLDAYAKACP
jgi:hypothetical protein